MSSLVIALRASILLLFALFLFPIVQIVFPFSQANWAKLLGSVSNTRLAMDADIGINVALKSIRSPFPDELTIWVSGISSGPGDPTCQLAWCVSDDVVFEVIALDAASISIAARSGAEHALIEVVDEVELGTRRFAVRWSASVGVELRRVEQFSQR